MCSGFYIVSFTFCFNVSSAVSNRVLGCLSRFDILQTSVLITITQEIVSLDKAEKILPLSLKIHCYCLLPQQKRMAAQPTEPVVKHTRSTELAIQIQSCLWPGYEAQHSCCRLRLLPQKTTLLWGLLLEQVSTQEWKYFPRTFPATTETKMPLLFLP